MNFVIQNCCGAQSLDFCRNFRNMLNYYRPTILVLLKTHVTDHSNLCSNFGFNAFIEAPAEGLSGGTVLLWNDSTITVTEISITNQEVHYIVQVSPSTPTFMFSVIYAKNSINSHKILWYNLVRISDTWVGPWLVGGDFNDIAHSSEKFGGQPINNARAFRMLDCFNTCNLINLSFRGSHFTWTNKHKKTVTDPGMP